MAKNIIETKQNGDIELYTKDSTSNLVKRVGKFSSDGSGLIIGSAGVDGATGIEGSNIKLHRGEKGLQVLFSEDTTPDGKTNTGETPGGFVDDSSFPEIIGVSNRITAQFDMIVGSTSDVMERKATHDRIKSALDSIDFRINPDVQILILNSYNTENPPYLPETIEVNNTVSILGKGYSSEIDVVFTLKSGAKNSLIKFLKFKDNIVIEDDCNNLIITDCWIANGKTIIDKNTNPNNLITILEEE